ncbi:MAG: OsmC family protein [Saprospiraceae bacterium]|nr:OsmC family protein [Saprospiraceae bacterium]
MKKSNKPPTATVSYHGDLRSEATHIRSGSKIQNDAPTDNHGKGMKFSPTDMMATSLATCMLTVMGIRANKMEGDLKGSTAEVFKYMASNPRWMEKVEVRLTLKGQFSEDERALLERIAIKCPVARSFHPDVEQVSHFTWIDT